MAPMGTQTLEAADVGDLQGCYWLLANKAQVGDYCNCLLVNTCEEMMQVQLGSDTSLSKPALSIPLSTDDAI